jgi:hypothetical protein
VSLECRGAWNPVGRFADIEDFQDFGTIAALLRKGVFPQNCGIDGLYCGNCPPCSCSWPSLPYREKSEGAREAMIVSGERIGYYIIR